MLLHNLQSKLLLYKNPASSSGYFWLNSLWLSPSLGDGEVARYFYINCVHLGVQHTTAVAPHILHSDLIRSIFRAKCSLLNQTRRCLAVFSSVPRCDYITGGVQKRYGPRCDETGRVPKNKKGSHFFTLTGSSSMTMLVHISPNVSLSPWWVFGWNDLNAT